MCEAEKEKVGSNYVYASYGYMIYFGDYHGLSYERSTPAEVVEAWASDGYSIDINQVEGKEIVISEYKGGTYEYEDDSEWYHYFYLVDVY